MLTKDFKNHLEERFEFTITSFQALSGGDINEVFHLVGNNSDVILKVNDVNAFPDLFQKEANGLKALAETNSIDIPDVLGYGDFKTNTYLLMEYKDSVNASNSFWECFGQQLADLHRHTQDTFGFTEDNYIGSLPQYNRHVKTASEFFIQQRLEPQFEMASQRGYDFDNLKGFYHNLKQIIPDEPPALIHGDLWSGNYLINSEHNPCLIDPAVAYAPREMDLAMMKLFGGFDDLMFRAYQDAFPLEKGWEKRILLWQLYYILVHVNLFGGHYYQRAKGVLSYYLS